MNTRKALSVFQDREVGDTYLPPAAATKFAQQAAERSARIEQQKREPSLSLPHARLAASIAARAERDLLDANVPVVDKFSAYQVSKRLAEASPDSGLRSLVQHLAVHWNKDPRGFFTAAELCKMREHYARSFGRTAAVEALSSDIPRAGVGDLPVRRLAELAQTIKSQADYVSACKRAGIDGMRPDHVRARDFLRALVRRADVMDVEVNQQQGPELTGIPADNGGGVLSGADLEVKKAASFPSPQQVERAVLDANQVRIAGYTLFINDRDLVELRTPNGASRIASISQLPLVVRDFLRTAQAADFEPSINEQQDPVVSILDTEGGDVIGEDSQTDDSLMSQFSVSVAQKNRVQPGLSDTDLGQDTERDDPSWANPSLSGAHASDPHRQPGTSFSDKDLEPDRAQDEPSWGHPQVKAAELDDSVFTRSDPAERYRQAMANRPSARLLEGIADEQGWLARRAFDQVLPVAPSAPKTVSESVREVAQAHVARLREDLVQVGEGVPSPGSRQAWNYTFGYSTEWGQPRQAELQRFIDACNRGYRVVNATLITPGLVQATIAPAVRDFSTDAGVIDKRTAVRRALGKIAEDLGSDPAGMGSDYAGTALNKEAGHWCEKCQVEHRDTTECPHSGGGTVPTSPTAPAPAAPAAPVQPPEAPLAKLKGKGLKVNYKGSGQEISGEFEVPGYKGGIQVVQSPSGQISSRYTGKKPPSSAQMSQALRQFKTELKKGASLEQEASQEAIKPVSEVPSLEPKQSARISEGWGEGGEYKRDVEAESAQEVWELHKGLGGDVPEFQQQQQQAQQVPIEPRPDSAGQIRFPEPEPQDLNAAR